MTDTQQESPQGPEDPFLEAELDRALAPYKALRLPPEMLQHYRNLLSFALTTHPLGKRLLDRARPRPPMQKSGTVPTGDADQNAVDESNSGRVA